MNFTRPNILNLLAFEGADFFGAQGTDSYTQDSALDCLGTMLDEGVLSFTKDIPAWLATNEQFWTVSAVKRDTGGAGRYADYWGKQLAECLREWFGEEHGDEDGEDRLSDDDIVALEAKMLEVTQWYLTRVKVWPCLPLRDFTLDRADILELVQQLRPEWLAPKEPT